MKQFQLKEFSTLPQKEIFRISTDIENFHKIMPNYFKSLEIVQKNKNQIIVDELITFLGFKLDVRTKHVVIAPNIHEVHILTGPTRGTSFIESYVDSGSGTSIDIVVNLQFNGFLTFFSFLHGIVAKKMAKTMNEFIRSAEMYASTKIT